MTKDFLLLTFCLSPSQTNPSVRTYSFSGDATAMCTEEDDDVFECEEPSTGGTEDSTKRRSQSLSSLNSPAATTEKVSKVLTEVILINHLFYLNRLFAKPETKHSFLFVMFFVESQFKRESQFNQSSVFKGPSHLKGLREVLLSATPITVQIDRLQVACVQLLSVTLTRSSYVALTGTKPPFENCSAPSAVALCDKLCVGYLTCGQSSYI